MRILVSPPLRRHPLFVPLAIAGAAFVLFVAGFVFYDNTHVFHENYSGANPKMAAMVSRTEGWVPGDDNLAVERGKSAWITYDFYKAMDHAVQIDVETRDVPGLTVKVSLHFEKEHIPLVTLPGGQSVHLDLTHALADHYGVFRIRFDATLAKTAPVASCHPFKGFTLTLRRPRSIHIVALLFFAIIGALLYGAIVGVVVQAVRRLVAMNREEVKREESPPSASPEPSSTPSSSPPSAPSHRPPPLAWLSSSGATLVLALAIGFGLVASHPGWLGRKKFDDVRAIGNAATLLDNGFDVNMLYFRGRTRPGFVAWACPLVRLYRQTILRVQKTPADFYRKIWEEYDRDDATYSQCLQLGISLWALALAGASLVLLAAIGAHLGVGRGALPLAVFLAAVFFRRALEIPITQTHEFFMGVAAVASWFQWREMDVARARGRTGWLFLAAFMMGMAVLTKTSTITSIIPILLYQAVLVVNPHRAFADRKRDIGWFLVYWVVAAVIVLVWFQGFLEGAVAEYARFWKEHLAAQGLQGYASTSLAAIWEAFRQVFGIWGLALAAVGVVGAIARQWRIHLFVWFWILGAMIVFRMPYIFPRFFQYFIPAFSFLAAEAVVGLIRLVRKWTAKRA